MAELHFQTLMNPFGILYNPLSMATALHYCLDDKRVGEEDLVFQDGLWHSWLHHGVFSCRDKQACLDACNNAISEAHAFIESCNTMIVTFGSAWYYQLKPCFQTATENGQPPTPSCQSPRIVANCHKVPAAMFDKKLATIDDVVSVWQPLAERLLSLGMRLVFTVSPVRHQAYGPHGNQLGKAVLLLATEQLIQTTRQHDNLTAQQLSYFPAYEILVDELRDYRFYADDLSHPSQLAEEIVWQRFQETYMTPDTIVSCDEIERQNRRSAHRPLH